MTTTFKEVTSGEQEWGRAYEDDDMEFGQQTQLQ